MFKKTILSLCITPLLQASKPSILPEEHKEISSIQKYIHMKTIYKQPPLTNRFKKNTTPPQSPQVSPQLNPNAITPPVSPCNLSAQSNSSSK